MDILNKPLEAENGLALRQQLSDLQVLQFKLNGDYRDLENKRVVEAKKVLDRKLNSPEYKSLNADQKNIVMAEALKDYDPVMDWVKRQMKALDSKISLGQSFLRQMTTEMERLG